MILFDDSYLLLGKSFNIDENIIVNNPKLHEIFDLGEEKYNTVLSPFISKPSDYKIQLFDAGIDFEEISEFDFFYLLVKNIAQEDSKILFGDIDFSKMGLYICTDTQEKMIGYDNTYIDELAYSIMSDFIRKINGIPIKKPEKYANAEAKKYIMDMERSKLKYAKREKFKSSLIPIVSGLVNSPECSYTYESIMDLTISQLYDALSRVMKIKNYNSVIQGLYAGTISSKEINQNEINWLA